nr:GIY-YIG nuclease family protein [uncultured Microbacterium sp.]
MPTMPLPDPCLLCGRAEGDRIADALVCVWCGWRFGDVPDADLPRPVIEVVYYIRYDRRVKIGTSRRPRQRLASIRHEELLAFEKGGRAVEQARHRQFAEVREGGEWFTLSPALGSHIDEIRAFGDPWQLYARWVSDALR